MREPDLNRRPSGYEPDELPGCSIPRLWNEILQFCPELSIACLQKSFLLQSLSAPEKGCRAARAGLAGDPGVNELVVMRGALSGEILLTSL
ncbi:protein of unknown function [Pseudomonas sp. JV241A]|nr:protein of unknown function [Pseudomonas sp. JV241A]